MTHYLSRFFRDLERCPYIPGEPGYDVWCAKDQQRLKELEERRQRILQTAKDELRYCNLYPHSTNIKEMAEFIIESLDKR